jgi:hypothetical protein
MVTTIIITMVTMVAMASYKLAKQNCNYTEDGKQENKKDMPVLPK